MDDQLTNEGEPPSEQNAPTRDWTSYHEHTEQQVDVGAMAALVRRVGGELSKIDSQSVSSSTAKVEKIDKQRLIRELNKPIPGQSSNSAPPPVVPQQAPPPVVPQQAPPVRSVSKPKPPPIPVTNNTGQASLLTSDIEKRIERLESATRLYRKAKKIKRGLKYKVSSNSVKGVIKDAELIGEFVISELAKGVKSITIKLDESTDTQ